MTPLPRTVSCRPRPPCAANRLQWRVRDAMARRRTGPALAGGRPWAAHVIHSSPNHSS
ncbi:hypothetical protein F01_200210 [Burkholderia cenocepacia]|nr:hypothetical protein F01_200210 [Burkholderia cenocepacia]